MFIYNHPFSDCNERLARLISNFILEKYSHPIKEKNDYIESLKASEKDNSMFPIINLFYDIAYEAMKKKNKKINYL